MKANTFYSVTSIVGKAAIVLMFVISGVFYHQLPEQIPTHFNFKGKADAFGAKQSIWGLALIGLLLYVGLFYVNKYLIKKVNENAHKDYLKAIRVNTMLSLFIALSFCYITFQTVFVALGKSQGLGTWFLPVFIIASILLPLLPLIKSEKK